MLLRPLGCEGIQETGDRGSVDPAANDRALAQRQRAQWHFSDASRAAATPLQEMGFLNVLETFVGPYARTHTW